MKKDQKRHLFSCPVGKSLAFFSGRWKPEILWHLRGEPMRFNQLLRTIGSVSQKMLTQQLRELERDGLVERTQYPEIPPRVEYKPTPLALSLRPLFSQIAEWGAKHESDIEKSRTQYKKEHKTL
jgi:DNA-binding HxlR family transcriptional regulator